MSYRAKIILNVSLAILIPMAAIFGFFYINHKTLRQEEVTQSLRLKTDAYRFRVDTLLDIYTSLSDSILSRTQMRRLLSEMKADDKVNHLDALDSIFKDVIDSSTEVLGIEIVLHSGQTLRSGATLPSSPKRMTLSRGDKNIDLVSTPEHGLRFSFSRELFWKNQAFGKGIIILSAKKMLNFLADTSALKRGGFLEFASSSYGDFKLYKEVNEADEIKEDLQSADLLGAQFRIVDSDFKPDRSDQPTFSQRSQSKTYDFSVQTSAIRQILLENSKKFRNNMLMVGLFVMIFALSTLIKLYSPILNLVEKARFIANTEEINQIKKGGDIGIIGTALDSAMDKLQETNFALEEKNIALQHEIEANHKNEQAILKMVEDINGDRKTLHKEIELRTAAQTALNSAIRSTQEVNIKLKNTVNEKITIETELFKKSSMLAATVECMAEGLVYTNIKNEIILMNPAARRILGLKDSKVAAKDWEQFNRMLDPDDKTPIAPAQLPMALASTGVAVKDQVLYCQSLSDHPSCYININANPVIDTAGNLSACVVTFNDISEKREYIKNLSRTNAELRRSNIDLDNFAYVASHDLKSPIRGIDNLAKWIQEDCSDVLPAQACQDLASLRSRAKRMEDLLEGLLRYAQVGQEMEDVEDVHLCSIVENISSILDKPPEFRINCLCPETILTAKVTPLTLVLRNLITNAVKHRRDNHGTVSVDVSDKDEYFLISVKDDGPGIAEEHREKIFGIFKTLKRRDEFEASGLGLAIVKKIISREGGSIYVEDNGEKPGVCFKFTWPRKADVYVPMEGQSIASDHTFS